MSTPAVTRLVEGHRDFLGFLERRLGDRALAEDVLQDAFVRGVPRADAIGADAVVAWFYQVLRNAIVDVARRRGASTDALARLAAELGDEREPSPDTRNAICRCVTQLAANLKDEYAAVLAAVDVEDGSIAAFAASAGITPNNASVRLHRARASLKREVAASCGTCAEHGCVDCTCRPAAEVAALAPGSSTR